MIIYIKDNRANKNVMAKNNCYKKPIFAVIAPINSTVVRTHPALFK